MNKRLPMLVACLAAGGLLALPPHATAQTGGPPAAAGPAGAPEAVGVDEKLGQLLPADAVFYDEHEVRHTLGDVLDRPTILALVYYHCPGACSMIQGNLARALQSVPDTLGKDYQVISISFDDEETPEEALAARENYVSLVGTNLPENAWRFMTGDAESIRRTCDAVGFRFQQTGHHAFTHPNLVTVLGKNGQVIRYLYGTEYLPLDIGMAIAEAERGTPGISIKKIVSYCFDYDPQSRRYTFRLFRVFGTTTLVVLGCFLWFLLRKGRGSPSDGTGAGGNGP